MKFSKIILGLAFILLTNTFVLADDINPLLIAGSKNQPEQTQAAQPENMNLDNSEIIIPQEICRLDYALQTEPFGTMNMSVLPGMPLRYLSAVLPQSAAGRTQPGGLPGDMGWNGAVCGHRWKRPMAGVGPAPEGVYPSGTDHHCRRDGTG